MINLTKTKKIALALIIIVLLLGVILLNIVSLQKRAIVVPTIPLLPTPSVKVSPPVITPNPLQNPRQKITINWNNVKIPPSAKVGLYHITSPLVDQETVNRSPSLIGYTSSDQQETYKDQNFLWSRGSSFLHIALDNHTLIYQAGSSPSASVKPNLEQVSLSAIQILGKFFPSVANSFTLENLPVPLLLVDYTDQPANPVAVDKAEIFQVNLNQQIENMPVITESGNGLTVQIFLYNSLELLRLNVKGGYKRVTQVGSLETLSPEVLIQTAENKVRLISSTGSIADLNHSQWALSATLDVKTVKLAYLQTKDDLMYPHFLITGTLKTNDIVQEGVFFTPAYQEN